MKCKEKTKKKKKKDNNILDRSKFSSLNRQTRDLSRRLH